jgi:DNA-binding response OmpR family regulator
LRSGSYDGVLVVLLDSQFGSSVVPVLNAGADDCLFHPIDGDVLVARLRAASRRFTRRTQTVSGVRVAPNPLLVGDILGAGAVRLTRTEERLLMALRDADGGVVPNQRLCAAASPNAPLSRESLQVHVAHLRLKLGNEKWRLKNCRAMGYLLAPSKDC